ncbi:hypothetical protein [uncultured Bacteroides sp.]|uniref:hypothetical protein n=1 Tax=uncultured Bacteroides sp. TaxID=162156 RepID=UPI0025D977B2|nr:hypothetical protein [uncultured Bacteroides sp.]
MITFADGSTISYMYSADEAKLCTIHKIGSTTTKRTIVEMRSMKTEYKSKKTTGTNIESQAQN